MDPIADMLVTIKNGYMAKKLHVSLPYSNFKFEIVKVLEKEKFVGKVNKKDTSLEIQLLYNGKEAKIDHIRKISKLGRRVYFKSKQIHPLKGGRGTQIISTPQGVMAAQEAKKKKLGGEVICEVW